MLDYKMIRFHVFYDNSKTDVPFLHCYFITGVLSPSPRPSSDVRTRKCEVNPGNKSRTDGWMWAPEEEVVKKWERSGTGYRDTLFYKQYFELLKRLELFNFFLSFRVVV